MGRQGGFTLIELLVVLSILGALSVVALPNILGFMSSGKTEAAKAEQHNLQVAATAAKYACENDASLTFDDNDGGAQVWTASGSDKGSASYYLVNDTKYSWIIDLTGLVKPDTQANGNPIGA